MTNQLGNPSGFGTYIAAYAAAVAANFGQQLAAQPEDQLKAPVGELLKALGRIAGKTVDYRTEVRADDIDGRPDIGVTVDGQLIGLIELKAPGVGARPETFSGHNAEQWKRFREFPNLIYTDGAEWSLYQNGERRSRIRITDDIRAGGAHGVISSERHNLEMLLVSFLEWGPTAPATAEGLAAYLAPLTRLLRDEVRKSLGRPDSSLRTLATEWAGLLFPEGDDAQFADAYAQTVTYALLLARFEGADRLQPAFAAEVLRRGHGLLSEALRLLEADSVRDELRMPIELLERAVSTVDAPRLNRQGDPWLYFYEQFLGAYDPELRKNRGVFYTPVEVVGVQTRLAAELLRTRFDKTLGFAEQGVNVLDPAAGTGAYLLSVLNHAAFRSPVQGLTERNRLFVAGAYSVAHAPDATLAGGGRNGQASEGVPHCWNRHRPPEFHASIMQEQLTHERTQAQRVKNNTVFSFVSAIRPARPVTMEPAVGPPGMHRISSRLSLHLCARPAAVSTSRTSTTTTSTSGAGRSVRVLGGRDGGIVTFITASSTFADLPWVCGARCGKRSMNSGSGGDSLGARKTENVFTSNAAIAIGVRDGTANPGARKGLESARRHGR